MKVGLACGLLLGSVTACASPEESSPPRFVYEADLVAAEADAPVSGEDFVFGTPDDTGISIGLRIENPHLSKTEKLRYEVAIRNEGDSPRLRWFTSPPSADTFLVARNDPLELYRAAWDGRHAISMEVYPGETRARSGTPIIMGEEGTFRVHVEYGGLFDPHWLDSGSIEVEVTP